ncbi:DUF4279 domain-containing protein [Mesorhizobium sp. ES1-1]|uniref:DUF4279 domain-containing protein n=1 Tax=Mesorhizobium sp. ES1-1 TaxID=2876629 RepID=UPI001CCBD30D|nr:DUF4279 domain-containing protein [Mesorhizobium sp. ES1-1]MBZ9675346.1 DUF4279 domain-containing protein [Mesorhizobium sp. ES1-1]
MAEIARSSASLRFFGDDLDPDELTGLLAGHPSYAVRKGDFHTYRPNRATRTALKGLWRLSSAYQEGDQLDQQIVGILQTLTEDFAVWADLSRRFEVDMFCGVWLDEGNQGLALSPQTLQMLGERGIKLELNIYYELPETDAGDDDRIQADTAQPLAK